MIPFLTQVLASGTASTSVSTTPVDLLAYAGQCELIVDCGPALNGAGTMDLRVESSGTASGLPYATWNSAGTLPSFSSAGSLVTYPVDIRAASRYLRVVGAIGS